MAYILNSSDTGVPLLKCLLAGVRLSHVMVHDTWMMTSMTCPLGALAACCPLEVSQLPGDEMSPGVHILDPMARCPPE